MTICRGEKGSPRRPPHFLAHGWGPTKNGQGPRHVFFPKLPEFRGEWGQAGPKKTPAGFISRLRVLGARGGRGAAKKTTCKPAKRAPPGTNTSTGSIRGRGPVGDRGKPDAAGASCYAAGSGGDAGEFSTRTSAEDWGGRGARASMAVGGRDKGNPWGQRSNKRRLAAKMQEGRDEAGRVGFQTGTRAREKKRSVLLPGGLGGRRQRGSHGEKRRPGPVRARAPSR